jgi:large subunit ribosomal protein L6
MSRIGKAPISIPRDIEVKIVNNLITVKNKTNELNFTKSDNLDVKIENDQIVLTRKNEEVKTRELHGLTRTLINNMLVGLTSGYKRDMEIVGVGYKIEVKGKKTIFNLGHSHPIYFYAPAGVEIKADSATKFSVMGFDKELVGMIAAKIRSFRPPEPYKGKGVKYANETILRKAGKTGKKK